MGQTVVLNIYDLSEYNTWLYWAGIGGIFHTGVEVFSEEFAFGGHEYDVSGIFVTLPRDAPVSYRESIILGETELSKAEVHRLVQQMGREYKGNLYHLLQRNCNHFSDDLAFRLCGSRTPSWINRLAGVAVCLHCLLPQTWVPPLAIPTASPAVLSGADTVTMSTDEHQNLLSRSGVQPYHQSAEVQS